jgi:quinol-cytochrome oxidoreductase complex cytochrome b subunit
MIIGPYVIFNSLSYCLYWLCITVGTDEFLGATVIINFLTVVPYIGSALARLL